MLAKSQSRNVFAVLYTDLNFIIHDCEIFVRVMIKPNNFRRYIYLKN